ncbi:MAG: pyridoxal phosphate-dependent aminotransferase [Gemmatimonadetes bacterium]|nr:pyridoxal phosphate-dependent aminotransferase [Gemmatimonadota bacterium]
MERATVRTGAPLRGVVLSRLHNPSGATVPEEFLKDLARLAERHDFHVLVDEVFLDMLPDAVPAHRLSPRLLSTGSLTKVYGFGGLRCGWIIGDGAALQPLKELSFYLSVDGAASSQATGVRVLERRDEFLERARAISAAGLGVLEEWVDSRDDVTWVRPAAGINAFLDLPGVRDVGAFADGLFEDGVNVAPGAYFGRPGGVRVSVGGDPTNVRQALLRLGRSLDTCEHGWFRGRADSSG